MAGIYTHKTPVCSQGQYYGMIFILFFVILSCSTKSYILLFEYYKYGWEVLNIIVYICNFNVFIVRHTVGNGILLDTWLISTQIMDNTENKRYFIDKWDL